MAVLITGIVSTPTVDAERHSVLPGAFDLSKSVPFLWRHEQKERCGEIVRLWQDGERVMVRARVDDDALARQATGFSVSFSVNAYEIKNRNRPDYYSSISKATLSEVSLVLNPCNPDCIVLRRDPYADHAGAYRKAMAEQSDLMIHAIQLVQQKVKLCQAQLRS